MSLETDGGLALYAAKLSGTLGKMERSMLATKVAWVSWATFTDVEGVVSAFLEGCSDADEKALPADFGRIGGYRA